MHPILAQGRRLALYLLLFFQAGLLLAEVIVRQGGVSRVVVWLLVLPPVLLHAFSCLASWYLCRGLPLGETPVTRLLVSHTVAGGLASGLMLGAGELWSTLLGRASAVGRFDVWTARPALPMLFGLLLYTSAVAVHYLLEALATSRAAQRQTLELELLAQGAELRALRAQVDPHFLFNSLNSIAALVTADPAQARRMCVRLAGFLRHSLEVGKSDLITLRQELELVDDYLSIEQVRFGDRLAQHRRVAAGCEGCRLPPLLLQPLVENAVRHGVGGLVDGGRIEIVADCADGELRIRVENPVDPDRRRSPSSGIGLENVRRRLATRYGQRGKLRLRADAERFRAEITLPAERRPEPASEPSTELRTGSAA